MLPRTLLIGLFSIVSAAAHAAPCVRDTLDKYVVDGFECTIEDKIFRKFFYSSKVDNAGVILNDAPPANRIQVAPIRAPDGQPFSFNPGVAFSSASWVVAANQTLESIFDFIVVVPADKPRIKDARLDLLGNRTNDGSIADDETIFSTLLTPNTRLLQAFWNQNQQKLTDSKEFAAVDVLEVHNVFRISGGLMGTAQVSSLENRFSEVCPPPADGDGTGFVCPAGLREPASLALAAVTLLALAWMRSTRRTRGSIMLRERNNRGVLENPIVAMAAGAALMLTSVDARAGAIAYAVNDVFNFRITPGIAGNLTFANSDQTRSSTVALSSRGLTSEIDRDAPFDPPLSCLGAGCANIKENDFRPHGPHAVKGDAIIDAVNPVAGARFRNDALMNLSASDGGFASGRNTVIVDLDLAREDTLTLAFDTKHAVDLALHADARGQMSASIGFRIRIGNLVIGGGDITRFRWEPDGTVNDEVFGGRELLDDANLQVGATVDEPGETFRFDPAGTLGGLVDGTECAVLEGCHYRATTDMLAPRRYFMIIEMVEGVEGNIREGAGASAPSVLSLLGLGLILLGLARRPRSNAAPARSWSEA